MTQTNGETKLQKFHSVMQKVLSLDTTTLVFLAGLTADHRLFDKQVAYFDGKYNIIVWDAPAHAF